MGSEEQCTGVHLSERFTVAIEYARQIHTGFRKGTQVPYLAHLLGVASLVLGEAGNVPFAVTEDMAIAALLHDAVEDAGGLPRLADIEARFGKAVGKIVEGCSDSFAEDENQKPDWKSRKAAYIERAKSETAETLLVSLADKVYNARSIAEDYRRIGPEVWKRFNRGRAEQLWYYDELMKIFEARCPSWRLFGEFQRAINELKQLSAAEENRE
jgi:(p)ppGpp synthase/HD superfamily hydrolase